MLNLMSHPETPLNAEEKLAYRELFKLADVEQKSFLAKSEAMSFFSKSGIPTANLEEFWRIADEGEKNYITETEFYTALKLIACALNGVKAMYNILTARVSLPQLQDIPDQYAGMIIAPISVNEREKYIGLFQSCYLVNGLLSGDEAKNIFMKSKLPNDILNRIWTLADTRNSGTLNATEFIIAMHYISRCMSNPSLVLPVKLPFETYSEASGRSLTPILKHNTAATSPVIPIRAILNKPSTSPITIHRTVSSSSSRALGVSSLELSPQEIGQYKTYFVELDTDKSGYIDSDEAVYFFSHSHLSESELGVIWEIADIKQLGKLDFQGFSVAMHLINKRKNGESIDKYHNYSVHYNQLPAVSNEAIQQQVEQNQRYELENMLVEIKQQMIYEQKSIEVIQSQLDIERQSVCRLEIEASDAKAALETSRKYALDEERLLEYQLQKKDEILGYRVPFIAQANTPKKVLLSSLPELTRAPSSFSGSSVMSPRSDSGSAQVVDPFSGFNKSNQEATNVQKSKSVSKYGFDITAFDALSIEDNGSLFQKSSFNEDLASLFGATIILPNTATNIKTSDFDNIFM